ncbi:MAG TPA: hypothetical protein VGN35_04960 [Jatrophihabitantaceae bacterium]|jgi:hypothetical protein|nr:hypothetical protein [Jatrophihabitantaceae bacterium]
MTEAQWIRSHVERLLQAEWDTCRVIEDDDGDYPFRGETSACWVSIVDSTPVMVRVFAHAAHGIKPSAKVYAELNDIQSRALSAAVSWSGGVVLVTQTISPIGLTQPVLAQAMRAVMGVADDVGTLIASSFGGSTPYQAQITTDEEVGGGTT